MTVSEQVYAQALLLAGDLDARHLYIVKTAAGKAVKVVRK